MNAYELADELLNYLPSYDAEKFANMLRQLQKEKNDQADRIAELEKLVSQRFDDGKRLGIIETEDRLRTTPQLKQLSDEEILNVAFCSEVNTVSIENDWDETVITFARAILRKAQDK